MLSGKKRNKVLKGITILKYQQNPTLKRKLIVTGDTPLYNCDLDSYWRTGRNMDSPQWDELMLYPGRNVVLHDVRERLKPPGLKSSTSPPDVSRMNISAIESETTMLSKLTAPKKLPAGGEKSDKRTTEQESRINKAADAQAMATDIKPTVIPNSEGDNAQKQALDVNTSVG